MPDTTSPAPASPPNQPSQQPRRRHFAYRCGICQTMPAWRLLRHRDAVITWACDFHLPRVLRAMQRPAQPVTGITVTPHLEHRDLPELKAVENVHG